MGQAVSDDITYIQSQDRGLQVQTQNQRALLGELEELLVCFSLILAISCHKPYDHSKPCKLIVTPSSLLRKSRLRRELTGLKAPQRSFTRPCRQEETEVSDSKLLLEIYSYGR